MYSAANTRRRRGGGANGFHCLSKTAKTFFKLTIGQKLKTKIESMGGRSPIRRCEFGRLSRNPPQASETQIIDRLLKRDQNKRSGATAQITGRERWGGARPVH